MLMVSVCTRPKVDSLKQQSIGINTLIQLPAKKTAYTNSILFGLTRTGIKQLIYHTLGQLHRGSKKFEHYFQKSRNIVW
jgi:hypothetical protein